MSTTIEKVGAGLEYLRISNCAQDNANRICTALDQGGRVRDGSDSEEQEHFLPLGYDTPNE